MDDAPHTTGLLASVARFKWVVAVIMLLGAAIGYGVASQRPVLYRASATLLLADPRDQTVLTAVRQSGNDPSRYVRNQARLVTSQPVMQRAAQLMNRPGEWLAVSAQAALDVDAIVVEAVDGDPHRAAATADAVTLAYEQIRREQTADAAQEAIAELRLARAEVERQLVAVQETLSERPEAPAALAERDAATQQLQVLLTRERQLAVDTALFGGGVDVREAAAVPTQPFQPQPLRLATAGLLLGFVVGSGAAWWWSSRRPPAVTHTHAARILGAPLLGEVPKFSRQLGPVPSVIDPLSAESEAYQFVTAALTHELRKRGVRTLLVTSANPGDGKTATVVNLAVVAARDGHRVVLVDADVRARGLTSLTGVVPELSMEEIARESVPIRRCLTAPDIEGMEGLRVAAMDPTDVSENPAWFLRSAGFGHALKRLGGIADFVIIDSPPVLAVADTFEMIPYVDAVLVVIDASTSDHQLQDVKRRLDLAGADIVGYVLNRSGSLKDTYAYGGGYASTSSQARYSMALPPAVRDIDDAEDAEDADPTADHLPPREEAAAEASGPAPAADELTPATLHALQGTRAAVDDERMPAPTAVEQDRRGDSHVGWPDQRPTAT